MASYPVYLHYLGYEKYGIWLVLTAVLTLAQLGNLGIGQAVTKFVAEHHVRGETAAINKYVTTANLTLCISGIIVLVLILGLRIQIIGLFKLNPSNASLAMWLLPYVGVLSLYIFIVRTVGATLSGLGRIDLWNYSSAASRVIAVASSAALLYAGGGVESLLIAYFLSEAMSHVFYIVVIRKIIRIRYWHIKDFDKQSLKNMIGLGSALMGGTLLNMLVTPFNKVMISRFIGVGSIPLYEIAYNAAMYIRNLVASGLGALTPEISALAGSSNIDVIRIRHIYNKSMKMIVFWGIPLFIVIYALATPLLELWLRQRYNSLLPMAFRIMLVGSFLSLLGIPAYYTIIGLGRSGKIFLTHIILSGTNILFVCIIVFIASLSVNSLAVASLMGMGLSSVYLIWQFRVIVDSNMKD